MDDLVDGGIDYRSAVQFIKNLNYLNSQNYKPIVVHMLTDGGDWYEGMGIYDAIVASIAPVTIIAYAHARSMSSIILQAADKRVLMPNCMFLIHLGTEAFADRGDALPAYYKQYEREVKTMLRIYAGRCKRAEFFARQTPLQVAEFIRKQLNEHLDWILTPEEAVHYGLADEVWHAR